jgi:hypothetical protein
MGKCSILDGCAADRDAPCMVSFSETALKQVLVRADAIHLSELNPAESGDKIRTVDGRIGGQGMRGRPWPGNVSSKDHGAHIDCFFNNCAALFHCGSHWDTLFAYKWQFVNR